MESVLSSKPTVFTLNRRRLLKVGVSSLVAAALPGLLLHAQFLPESCSPPIPQNHAPSNGGPWQYRFEGFKAGAQLEATIRVPSIDFIFKTDPMETSKCDFAVMGSEVNGKYYEAAKGGSLVESGNGKPGCGRF